MKIKSIHNVIALLLVAFVLAGCGGGTTSAEVVSVRIEPFTNPSGKQFQMVYVDWKNTGSTPVKVVRASVTIYDAQNNVVDSFTNTGIYYNNTGIAPGENYIEPAGEGYIVLALTPQQVATRAEASITSVESELKT
jgi:hypothetical protein